MMVAKNIEQIHSLSDMNLYQIFDRTTMPVCTLKMEFDEKKIQANFIISYCNQAMADYKDVTISQVMNHSIQEFFGHLDMKWYIDFADVALNNTVKRIKQFDSNMNKNIQVLCFQPNEGYCTCILMDRD